MIHFDFIVNDIDAENIIGCLQESENKCLRKIADLVFESSVVSDQKEKEDLNSQIDWYKSHREYLEQLQYKMKNTLISTHKNKKVYLVEPSAHGNGGWCGSEVIAHERLGSILSKGNPYCCYGGNYDLGYTMKNARDWGAEVRICLTEDPNDSIYIFNCEDGMWEEDR